MESRVLILYVFLVATFIYNAYACVTNCAGVQSPCNCSCGDWATCCCGNSQLWWTTPPAITSDGPSVVVRLTIVPVNTNSTNITADSIQDVANRLLNRFNSGALLFGLGFTLDSVIDLNQAPPSSSSSSSVGTTTSDGIDTGGSGDGDGDGEQDSAAIPLMNFFSFMEANEVHDVKEERQSNPPAVLNADGEAEFEFTFNSYLKGFDTRLISLLLVPLIQITDGGFNRTQLQWGTPVQTAGTTDVMGISGQVLSGVGDSQPDIIIYLSFNASSLRGPETSYTVGGTPPFSIRTTTILNTAVFIIWFKATDLSSSFVLNARFSPFGAQTDQEYINTFDLINDEKKFVQIQMLPV